MRPFTELYDALDSTTRTSVKIDAMVGYFRRVPPEDAAWAVYFLTGQRLKRLISGRVLRAWAGNRANLPAWLVDDAHAAVGDSAETVALLLEGAGAAPADLPLHRWIEQRILPLRGRSSDVQAAAIGACWDELPSDQAFILNKLLTGALRVGVARGLVVRALAEAANLPGPVVAHRLMGEFRPGGSWFEQLLAPEAAAADRSRPYPFYLASPLERDPVALGDPADWLVEWKWDGIRAQLVRRGGEVFLWSRGEELITDRFPEIAEAAAGLPDGTVLDGELLAWRDDEVLPFGLLQTRIGRDKISARTLREAPVTFLAYDLIERMGTDIRLRPLGERRAALEALAEATRPPLRTSSALVAGSWDELAVRRAESRGRRVEGLMLKRLGSTYGTGRQRGAWWKWKIDPYTVDAVLVYAQAGSGRRANLFTDYTFAVWAEGGLVPVAKAFSGLDDAKIQRLDRWIRRNTIERFGPVRSLRPAQVFELAFEGINASSRHKAGLALRFPRIVRWRQDKPVQEADRLERLQALLEHSPIAWNQSL